MTTEIPSHYRILTSKHEPELLHLSENERKCLLDDFMNLAAIENTDGKESQELFDLSDQISYLNISERYQNTRIYKSLKYIILINHI